MMAAKFSRLAAMDDPVSESLKVAILIMSLPNLTDYTTISASIQTIKSSGLTCNYVTMAFTEEQRRKMSKTFTNSMDKRD